jgi:hypothetical protein
LGRAGSGDGTERLRDANAGYRGAADMVTVG